jgi:hypothetical protein
MKTNPLKNQQSSLILLLLLIAFTSAKAQTDFIPGVLVNIEMDTLHGLIFQTNKNGNFLLEFKKSKEERPQEYQKNQVVSYRIIDGNYFETKTALINNKKVTGFFRCQVKGTVSLYSYIDDLGKNHLLISKVSSNDSTGLNVLEIENEIVNVHDAWVSSSGKFSKKTKSYARVLRRALLDCPATFPKISDLSLTIAAMKDLLKDYYDCTSEQYEVFKDKKVRGKPAFGAYGGINRFKNAYNSNWNFNGGIYMDLFLAGRHKRFSIQPHIVYSGFETTEEENGGVIHFPVYLASHLFHDHYHIFGAIGYDIGLRGIAFSVGTRIKVNKIKINAIIQFRSGPFTGIALTTGVSF